MADGERAQETKKKKIKNKRARKEDVDCLPSYKKIHIHHSKPEDGLTPPGPSSDDSNSPTVETGVFDFPWLKEGTTMMKSDVKFEDAFASSFEVTSVPEMFEAEDGLIVNGKCGWHIESESDYKVMNRKEEEVEDDGLECVWDSLLNQQPVSNIEF